MLVPELSHLIRGRYSPLRRVVVRSGRKWPEERTHSTFSELRAAAQSAD